MLINRILFNKTGQYHRNILNRYKVGTIIYIKVLQLVKFVHRYQTCTHI